MSSAGIPCDTYNIHLCCLTPGVYNDSLAIIEVAESVQPLHRLLLLITQVLAFETVSHCMCWCGGFSLRSAVVMQSTGSGKPGISP